MSEPAQAPPTGYLKALCSAVLSIPFAVLATPLMPEDNALFYFMGASMLFVLYSLISLYRA